MISEVRLTRKVVKTLNQLPKHIVQKLMSWIDDVEHNGLLQVRKCTGYHDEPLQGSRQGQRSIRLSQAYRAIYEIKKGGLVKFVSIEEVHKHDY